jgi:signal peptidase II
VKPRQQPADSPDTAAAAGWTVGAVPLNRYFIFFSLALLGCAADLLTKELIFRWRGLPGPQGIVWLVKGYVGIETALNRGALFGMGAGGSRYFAFLAIGAVIGVVVWLFLLRAARDRLLTVALGIISGGILGNLYDRLGLWDHGPLPPAMQNQGYETAVRDWILFCWNFKQFTWPNFNIADSLLVCGAGLLLWHAFLLREPNKP